MPGLYKIGKSRGDLLSWHSFPFLYVEMKWGVILFVEDSDLLGFITLLTPLPAPHASVLLWYHLVARAKPQEVEVVV